MSCTWQTMINYKDVVLGHLFIVIVATDNIQFSNAFFFFHFYSFL